MNQARLPIQHAADGIESFDQKAFERFADQARQLGFNEVLIRSWDPDVVLDTHTHPFSVQALVVAGSMWLSVDDQVHELKAGDPFSLGYQVPHAERYGPEGAVFWVARGGQPS